VFLMRGANLISDRLAMKPHSTSTHLFISITLIMLGSILNLFGQTSGTDLQTAVKQGAFLVDVRTPAEFSQGHVKGSVNIPLDRLSIQLDRFKGKETIVVFCRSGARSGQAKSILQQNGFANVVNGGGWQNVDQVVKAVQTVAKP
jgi:phage shock protein E